MTKPTETIRTETTAYLLNDTLIARLPEAASDKLPSRGQVAVEGTINGMAVQTVLEPDGYFGHWLRVSDVMQTAGIGDGTKLSLELTPTKEWPEPVVPADLNAALQGAPEKVQTKWHDITPMARWEWIRWMNATLSQETRAVRLEKTISKLAGKHRRPCCFNLAACTEPKLSKSGRLIGVTATK